MTDFNRIWSDIKNNNIEYYNPKDTYSGCSVYITDYYVFKKAPDSRFDDLWKSKNIIEYLYDMNICVPKVLFTSTEDNLVVYEKLDGETLKDVTDEEYAYSSGKLLKKIHEPEFNRFGDIKFFSDNSIYGELNTLKQYSNYTIEESKNYISEDSMFKSLFDRICDKIEDLDHENVKSRISHFDYNLMNIICQNNKCFVIDFMDAELGLPELDVVYQYIRMNQLGKTDKFISEFMNGYDTELSELSDIGLCLAVIHELAIGAFWEQKNETQRFKLNSYYNTIDSFAGTYVF